MLVEKTVLVELGESRPGFPVTASMPVSTSNQEEHKKYGMVTRVKREYLEVLLPFVLGPADLDLSNRFGGVGRLRDAV